MGTVVSIHQPEDEAQVVTDLANRIRVAMSSTMVDEAIPVERMTPITAAALALVIVEITQRVDPLFSATMIVNLGGNPFGKPN